MKADSKKYDPAIEYLHAQMLEIFHNKRQKSGGKKELVLFTMRSNLRKGKAEKNSLGWNNPEDLYLKTDVLDDAVNWFKKHNIPLYGINENPEQRAWTASPKAYGQLYIDDAALGCPIKYDKEFAERPFVDWSVIRDMLLWRGLI